MPASEEKAAEAAVRDVLQAVAGRLQGRLRERLYAASRDRGAGVALTYADVSEICREVAKEHGTDVYV